MIRMFKTEYYPDMVQGKEDGKRVLTLMCRVDNGKRFKSLTKNEKKVLVDIIERFETSLIAFKNDLK